MVYSLVEKTCTGCGVGYPPTLEYFSPDKKGKNGLQSRCKECKNAECRRYYRNNKKKRCDHNKVYNRAYYKTLKGYITRVIGNIKQRCGNPEHKSYEWYGGRGIKCTLTVDELYQWCIDNSVNPHGLQIDRIDNDGHYELGNIRFVTAKINCGNRRSSKKREKKF